MEEYLKFIKYYCPLLFIGATLWAIKNEYYYDDIINSVGNYLYLVLLIGFVYGGLYISIIDYLDYDEYNDDSYPVIKIIKAIIYILTNTILYTILALLSPILFIIL